MAHTMYDKWRSYTDGLVSPDSYIDFGFYYLISAALQRRVWTGPPHSPLYPNLYIILVGEPGIGKGLVIKQVAKALQFHKLRDPRENQNLTKDIHQDDKAMVEIIAEKDYETAMQQLNGKSKEKVREQPLLFPVAADATTYEALIKSLSMAIRRINYEEYDEKLQRKVMKPYAHSSLNFCLEEISSLFRKRTEDTVHLLLQAYDCGDYTYDTKTQGKDRIKRCCLGFFGGTTPGFMQSTFDDQLLTEGFSSRTFFIYATKNRKSSLWIPDLNGEQRENYSDILSHIERLSHLYGRVEIEPDTITWLEEWWAEQQKKRSNSSPRLNPYYARKQIHVVKLAMALHFADSFELKIELSSFKRAIEILDNEEKKMHLALGLEANNPLAKPMKKIEAWLRHLGPKTRRELAAEFWSSLPKGMEDLDVVLEHLKEHGVIEQFEKEHPLTKQLTQYFRINDNPSKL